MEQRAPARPVALVLLLAYSAALFLAALPAPARPDFLRAPSGLADQVLRRFFVRAGIPVFQPPPARIADVLRHDCIYVRGLGPDGGRTWIEPPDGRCRTEGLKLAIPDLEWMVRSLLTGGEGFVALPMQEAVLGDFFCHAPAWRAHRFAEIELLWVQPRFHIDTGAETTLPVFSYRWRCDPPGVIAEATPPDAALVRAFLEPDA